MLPSRVLALAIERYYSGGHKYLEGQWVWGSEGDRRSCILDTLSIKPRADIQIQLSRRPHSGPRWLSPWPQEEEPAKESKAEWPEW